MFNSDPIDTDRFRDLFGVPTEVTGARVSHGAAETRRVEIHSALHSGDCKVTVHRGLLGGYYAFVHCTKCGWTSGALRVPELVQGEVLEKTLARTRSYAIEVADEHLSRHGYSSEGRLVR